MGTLYGTGFVYERTLSKVCAAEMSDETILRKGEEKVAVMDAPER